jgi:hypothetical protein
MNLRTSRAIVPSLLLAVSLCAVTAGCRNTAQNTVENSELPPTYADGRLLSPQAEPVDHATCDPQSGWEPSQEYFGTWEFEETCGGLVGRCYEADPEHQLVLTLSEARAEEYRDGELQASVCVSYLVGESIYRPEEDMLELPDGQRYVLRLVDEHLSVGDNHVDGFGRGYVRAPQSDVSE